MRRTYKSKKDVGGGLDPRDVLLTLDEKSSAFDAFYIQNIKQTKRELSCMGASNHHGVASSRVRKRKYVKRIVKEVEPSSKESDHDSLSGSVFLTPDKSIHVKKALDPFDQLLNSSPAFCVDNQQKKEYLFDKLISRKESKTYTRKRGSKPKKCYFSDKGSDSEKENAKNEENKTQDLSDIHAYHLVIEKESKPSPKIDESINNIVNNISLLNNLKRKTSFGSAKKTFECNRNRLTKNIDSPLLQNSPLSSTPFTDKYRSKSIYKFSPIPIRDFEESPNPKTVKEDNSLNKSLILVSKHTTMKTSRSNLNPSPLTHMVGENKSEKETSSKSLFSSDSDIKANLSNNARDKDVEVKSLDNATNDKVVSTLDASKCKVSPKVQISSLQISELEPFLGFSNNTINQVKDIIVDSDKEDSIVSSTVTRSKCRQKTLQCSNTNNIQYEDDKPEQQDLFNNSELELSEKDMNTSKDEILAIGMNTSEVELTMPSQPFLGISEHKTDHDATFKSEQNSKISDNNKSVDESISFDSQNVDRLSSGSENVDGESLHSLCFDRESLYDTCNSDGFSEEKITVRKPLVTVERLNDSVFQKYYGEMADYGSSDNGLSESIDEDADEVRADISDAYASFESRDSNEHSDTEDSISFDVDLKQNENKTHNCYDGSEFNLTVDEIMTNNDLTAKEEDLNMSTNEEECVSFVTTRRGKEVPNNATIFILDSSNDSISSADCDQTVLNNTRVNVPEKSDLDLRNVDKPDCDAENVSLDTEMSENLVLINELELKQQSDSISAINTVKTEDSANEDKIISFVTNRKSNKLPRESNLPNISENTKLSEVDIKPGIVLQPGKKWERSLSIYKRMTMIADHFDNSFLDDDDLHTKGRRYRQSVISTMEMQDYRGSLHNESIHSRRSTFVSKPNRSTIRIVKETNNSSSLSLCSTTVLDDLKGMKIHLIGRIKQPTNAEETTYNSLCIDSAVADKLHRSLASVI